MAGRDPAELIDRALAAGPIDAPPEVQPELLACMLRRYADDLDGSRVAGLGLYERLVQRSSDMEIPTIAWHLAEVEIWAGRWREAQTYIEVGLDAARSTGSPGALMLMLSPSSSLHAMQGELTLARREAQQLLQIAQHGEFPAAIAWAFHLIAFAALSENDLVAVDEALTPLSEALLASGVGEPGMLRFVPDHVEALIRLGRHDEAETLLAPYQRRAEEMQRASAIGAASRCRALIDAATGRDPADAVAKALQAHRSLGMPFEHARTLLVAGEVMRRNRRRRLADEHLSGAHEIFVELGSPMWAARADSERRRLGLRTVSDELTATELRIARLAAAGRSNPEIASETFLALRTVEAHLTQVFRKLGIRSRIELPHRLAEV
jgi:ATP/maltotriose-dependent transcriptional regulator MalT